MRTAIPSFLTETDIKPADMRRSDNFAPSNFDPKLTAYRVGIVTKQGRMFQFDLWRKPFVKGMASSCGRVRVFQYKAKLNGSMQNVPGQFIVYVNGKRVPDAQFTIQTKRAKGRRFGTA